MLTTFCYGSNLGPAQAARHIAGVSSHELGTTARRHVTVEKLNKAIADVVSAFMELDLIKVWGDGSVVEKILKFSTLLTNAVIFHTTLDMMMVIRELITEGWTIVLEDRRCFRRI